MNRLIASAAAAAAIALGGAAHAATVSWASWTSDTPTSSVSGSITAPSGTVNVTYTGGYYFAQLNNTGTNYWNYTGGGTPYYGSLNHPATSDIIGLSNAGTSVITFSAPVTNVYLALISWNGANATLDHKFTIEAEGCGYWGCGTFVPNATDTGFTGNGEATGILSFAGPITSLTLTDTVNESWHGLTVGIGDLASATPEPGTWAMMLVGFGGLGAMMRMRRRLVAAA